MKEYKKPNVSGYFEAKAAFPAAALGGALTKAFVAGVGAALAASSRDIHSGQYRFLQTQVNMASKA